MPQLKFRGIKEDSILTLSTPLVDRLQEVLACPRDYFTIEVMNSTFVSQGKITDGYPLVEVAWFDRGQETQDKVAKIITEELKNVGYAPSDIFFTILKESAYYEDGKHF
ncbi:MULTISPECIES: DUF1904 domain-containing protein [Clostridium]|uniref:DUF1904 domain-containing protein n=1 Tax=Clostridium cadaveris TaxID=1529 RepID=A0A1I2JKV5_9CLOT|nr:DUF1904 domain-containing protein [Clostridium cadaveris]MDU4953362.1 DUF1904 domain-containing protein [Clostridium sp.]MDM8311003.1 DUF1904 domain-containing protein [Clostridium cadaveris]MDY4949057.1 DUF1904 domain-containing protein [Clostridium cadaveris]NME65450.1 DUF1904 domain-containing protein [Clostridium cadaveris]NWK10561.1 DUF1904 domain-containing protein [Clostridium cadaveris]